MTATIHHGDALDVLRAMPDTSVDSIVTDPPYGLSREPDMIEVLRHWLNGDDYEHKGAGFMGKSWDSFVPGPSIWRECYRVLKPGGHLVAFAGSRTYDLMGVAIRIAGFEIRDGLQWVYGSGFPKSLDVGKAIDKAAGVERKVVGSKLGLPGYSLTDGKGDHRTYGKVGNTGSGAAECEITAPATPEAERWSGWGTALKPSVEPIVLARKPLVGTVAGNVLTWGTGGINIDACRVPASDSQLAEKYASVRNAGVRNNAVYGAEARPRSEGNLEPAAGGRWPSNFVLSHASTPDGYDACEDGCVGGCPIRELDAQSGIAKDGVAVQRNRRDEKTSWLGTQKPFKGDDVGYGGEGGASRFFPTFRYQAKAGRAERPVVDGVAHPTVKPLTLMSWLCRLVTPPGGTVLDPFAGSGTTGEAALLDGFTPILIEQDTDYLPLIRARLNRATQPPTTTPTPHPPPQTETLWEEEETA